MDLLDDTSRLHLDLRRSIIGIPAICARGVPLSGTGRALIGWRRACPPEDCGGPWGYQDLLAILADPAHPEHRDRAEWIGRPFDPEAFDPARFADNLREGRLAIFDD